MTGSRDAISSDLALVRRVSRQVRPFWAHIAGIFVLGLVSAPLTLLTPMPLKIAVDSVVGSEPLPGWLSAFWRPVSDQAILIAACGLLVLIVLLSALQSLGSTLLRTYTAERIVLDFRTQLFRRVQRLSLAYHDMRGTSDSTYRIQYDAPSIQYIAIDGLIPFITAGITLVAMIVIIVRLDWMLALIALAISPVIVIATRISRRRLRRKSRDVKNLESSALWIIQEVLTSVRVVKAFVREQQEEDRFVRRSSDGMRARLRLSVLEGGLGAIVGLTLALGTAAVLYVGVNHVQTGQLTLGELLLVMGYLTQLYEPLRTISKKTASFQSHFASAERAFALLDEEPDVVEQPDARPVSQARGDIEYRNVSFAYQPGRDVLREVTLSVPAGAKVGISGTTGAGKTTLISLLCRFYDPTAGTILLDGVDLRDYRVADLRNQFAIVLQEPVLFSTSIAENIAYARAGATQHEIEAAAIGANAHEFITRLPHGYDTPVGERGMRLSGGERQRISLARAFLKNAPILILDEPTSSVDIQTEALIIQAMERLMEGRTTFIIAHRLGTLDRCDLRLTIEHGRLSQVVHGINVSPVGDYARGGEMEVRP